MMSPIRRLHEVVVIACAALLLAACSGGPKGDAARGKELYAQCAACHKLREHFTGPMHCGVVGRPAGSAPGFEYSDAMKTSGLTWTPETLDEFLTSPLSFVAGTKMGFVGFADPKDRQDVIAYLQQANGDPATCPSG